MSIPVLVFPGFSAGELSTFVIGRYLQNAGRQVHRWRLGVNGGRVPMFAREVLRERPEPFGLNES